MRDKKGRFLKGAISEKRDGRKLPCKLCGKFVYVPKYRFKSFGFCSRKCSSKLSNENRIYLPVSNLTKAKISKTLKGKITGDKHYNWQGGRQKHGDGYIQLYKPRHFSSDKRGRVLEHRYVMELSLGRKLTKNEEVHHINGNKLDNRIENLQVLSSREHSLLEWKNGTKENAKITQFSKGHIPWNKLL